MNPVITYSPLQLTEALVEREKYLHVEGTTTSVCIITLKGGFCAVGKSACVDRAEFNAELGAKLAREDAMREAIEAVAFLMLVSDAETSAS